MSNDKPTAPERSHRRPLPAAAEAAASLQHLIQLETFQKANAHVFPSVQSLRWFYRQHRQVLLESRAVVEISGRLLINALVFAEKTIEIGGQFAKARNER